MADDTPTLADIGNWLPDYVRVQNYQWPFANAAPQPATGTYGFGAADVSRPAVPMGYNYNPPSPATAPYVPAGVRGYAGELIPDRPAATPATGPSFWQRFLGGGATQLARPRQVPQIPAFQMTGGVPLAMLGSNRSRIRGV